MFIDEITIVGKAGNGGDGVVRWLREHGRAWGGPAGGNGGRGGSVYVRAVRDNNVLAKYTGSKIVHAENGGAGLSKSMYGKNGDDLYVHVPVGSVVTNTTTKRRFELFTPGETVLILKGGHGGLGNEYFKSSINRSPEEHTLGKPGGEGEFHIEVELVVDVGLIGEPNAGKSTLLNSMTRANSKVGAYPFTTLSPHLGDLYGYTLADIPGLIEGAAEGKGLGHTFLRHVKRTAMLLHLVSSEHDDVWQAYNVVRKELDAFDPELSLKEEWILLTKTDLLTPSACQEKVDILAHSGRSVFAISALDTSSIKILKDALLLSLRKGDTSATIAGL